VAERSRSLSLVYSGMFIGSILGLGLSPHMIAALGWPSVFYIFGSLGVVWYWAWRARAASTPADDPALSKAEKVGGRGWGAAEGLGRSLEQGGRRGDCCQLPGVRGAGMEVA
jgi:MFS family permease